jgi:hypothetical protein
MLGLNKPNQKGPQSTERRDYNGNADWVDPNVVKRTREGTEILDFKMDENTHHHKGHKSKDCSVCTGKASVVASACHCLSLGAHVRSKQGKQRCEESEGEIADKHRTGEANGPYDVKKAIEGVVKVITPAGNLSSSTSQWPIKGIEDHCESNQQRSTEEHACPISVVWGHQNGQAAKHTNRQCNPCQRGGFPGGN